MTIEQRIKEMLLPANHWGIEIAEVRKESHSSKEAGTLPEEFKCAKTYNLLEPSERAVLLLTYDKLIFCRVRN